MKLFLIMLTLLIFAGVVALGIYLHGTAAHANAMAAAGAVHPPTPVVVETLEPRKLRLWTQFSGRLHAIDYAEVRPQVSGTITDIKFADGQMVKQGDLLVVIDPRPYEAAVERDQAALTSAESKVTLAQVQAKRYTSLIESHSISQDELDNITNADRVAEAEEQNAEAVLKQAKLDLEHAYVTAPISGRTSRAEMTMGNLVQTIVGAPIVTTIVSQDGIYADFDVDEQTYLQTVRAYARGNAQEQQIPVQLVVQGDTGPRLRRLHRELRQPHRSDLGHHPGPCPLCQFGRRAPPGHVCHGQAFRRDGALGPARAATRHLLRPEQVGGLRRRR